MKEKISAASAQISSEQQIVFSIKKLPKATDDNE